jgi:hypothetical protein
MGAFGEVDDEASGGGEVVEDLFQLRCRAVLGTEDDKRIISILEDERRGSSTNGC